MVNRVILIGNLGKDPEVRRLESGAVVAKFSLATSESYKDKDGQWQEQTEWHDIVVWRNLAERAEQYLKKGSTIYLEGKLTHRSWQDAEGNPRRTTEVVGSYYRMLDRKTQPGTAPAAGLQSAPPHDDTNAPADPDDLPF
ncbi:MAG: hypothetical protein RL181_1626 [Bacteroidota bacterium]|jgi:single-strand DNA-binding protein